MKKVELPHFYMGKSYGSNQNWMMDPWMHLGGCAALTTCDIFLYMAMHRNREDLYKFKKPDRKEIDRKAYSRFAMAVKLYLEPRRTGIKDLKTYMDGVEQYLKDTGIDDIVLTCTEGSVPYETARNIITDSLDNGMPLAYLMLKHKNEEFEFFGWHWFIVNGYEEREDGIYIKAATYGKAHWLHLERLWDTGYEHKGGIVAFSIREQM